MTEDKKEKIYKYLQEQIAQADFRARAYVFNDRNEKNPNRNCFVKLKMHTQNYLQGQRELRWLIIPGFRGVGKTTLLAQLYYATSNPEVNKLFLSIDEIVQILGFSLADVLSVYEEILGTSFERLQKPVLLFLDEVHYDPQWGITLKTIFDRTKMVFVVSTGSAALTIQQNADVARRAFTEKLYPMSFTEYIKIKHDKYEDKGLAVEIRKSLYESKTAHEVHDGLKKLENRTRKYWLGIERQEVDRYMKYGTLPFAIKLENEGLAYEQIKKVIDRIISIDVPYLGRFDSNIVSRISEILYVISGSDMLSVTNLAQDMSISRNTLTDVLDVLELTEMLIRVYPYGAHGAQVKKPSKYLFSSPAFRSMYFHFVGNIIDQDSYKGKLFEDTVGLYLNKYIYNKDTSLVYDSSQKGADFILRSRNQNIIMEAGYGKKGIRQIQTTASRIGAKYGLSISMTPLTMGDDEKSVIVPISYFLLS
jgi:uncharacterized protein